MSLLVTLRTRTREAHSRLESDLDVLNRCRNRAAYGELLAAFRSVYAPLERGLDACPATAVAVPDWATRRKTDWLDADLAALGVAPLPDAAVPALRTAEEVAGVAYVLEGATLGGAVVLRDLQAGWADPLPQRFFTSYGEQRGRRWRAFRTHLEALPALDPEPAVRAAERTFDAFSRACLRPAA